MKNLSVKTSKPNTIFIGDKEASILLSIQQSNEKRSTIQ
jgi:hypothetical protein